MNRGPVLMTFLNTVQSWRPNGIDTRPFFPPRSTPNITSERNTHTFLLSISDIIAS